MCRGVLKITKSQNPIIQTDKILRFPYFGNKKNPDTQFKLKNFSIPRLIFLIGEGQSLANVNQTG